MIILKIISLMLAFFMMDLSKVLEDEVYKFLGMFLGYLIIIVLVLN